nr:NADP-dependent oxidoreductase [uncultured Serratia sp.]
MNQQLAAVMYSYGAEGTIKIQPINRPQVSPGKVIVEIAAAGVNPLDWKLRDGLLKHIFPLTFPCILGGEFAGKIVEVGAGVTTFNVGDRVIGKPVNRGAFAETIEIEPELLIPIPDDLDETVAATLPVAGSTAWTGLFDIGELTAGQTVLIQGAAGGVGLWLFLWLIAQGQRSSLRLRKKTEIMSSHWVPQMSLTITTLMPYR